MPLSKSPTEQRAEALLLRTLSYVDCSNTYKWKEIEE